VQTNVYCENGLSDKLLLWELSTDRNIMYPQIEEASLPIALPQATAPGLRLLSMTADGSAIVLVMVTVMICFGCCWC